MEQIVPKHSVGKRTYSVDEIRSILNIGRRKAYVVLLPIGDSDGQVVILQLKEIDDETEEYVGVENEFVLETVFALFKERNKDFFTFE